MVIPFCYQWQGIVIICHEQYAQTLIGYLTNYGYPIIYINFS